MIKIQSNFYFIQIQSNYILIAFFILFFNSYSLFFSKDPIA